MLTEILPRGKPTPVIRSVLENWAGALSTDKDMIPEQSGSFGSP